MKMTMIVVVFPPFFSFHQQWCKSSSFFGWVYRSLGSSGQLTQNVSVQVQIGPKDGRHPSSTSFDLVGGRRDFGISLITFFLLHFNQIFDVDCGRSSEGGLSDNVRHSLHQVGSGIIHLDFSNVFIDG